MSWAEHSCPAEEISEPPHTESVETRYAPAKWRFRIRSEDHKRDPALRLSLTKMAVNGFWQCLRCQKISHAEEPPRNPQRDCERCNRPLKFFPPVL